MAVYDELDRVPLIYTRLHTRLYSLIKYWSKVIVSIRQCYNEMYINCENFGHRNWAYDIKTLLSKLGFIEIWHKPARN